MTFANTFESLSEWVRKNLLGALLVAVGLFLLATASSAKAYSAAPATNWTAPTSDSFWPLQAAHAGYWYDESREGEGFMIEPFVSQEGVAYAFVVVYGGRLIEGVPAWYYALVPWHGSASGAYPLQVTKSVSWRENYEDEEFKSVGVISIAASDQGPNRLTATFSTHDDPHACGPNENPCYDEYEQLEIHRTYQLVKAVDRGVPWVKCWKDQFSPPDPRCA